MLLLIPIFILGLAVGSFLNVLVFRLNTGKSLLFGRSLCLSCKTTLNWYELLPVVSFCWQRGRCVHCGAIISFQYPLLELMSGGVFALAFLKFGLSLKLLIYILVSSIFLAITAYDLRHKIIPNQLIYPAIVLGLISQIVATLAVTSSFGGWTANAPNLLAGPIFFSFFALLWLVSDGKWMGFGDAKLVLAIGWLLGLSAGFAALLYGFWAGALVGIALLFVRRPYFTMKQEIPFAPFLIFGFFLASFLPWNIIFLLF